MNLKGGLKHFNNHCPRIGAYHLADIFDHDLMNKEPCYT